ncbi:MAG: hypothetical protein D6800_11080, partial [Candidatus Zixiibacteriota bacterium]
MSAVTSKLREKINIEYTNPGALHPRFRLAVLLLIILILAWSLGSVPVSSQSDVRAVPADFLYQLDPPGQTNGFLRPGAICADPVAHEVLVVDEGHNRIVVFNEEGIYRFEFSVAPYCGSVRDLAVSSDGFVFVIGSTADGVKLFRFDFDGQFLGEVAHPATGDSERVLVSSLGLDSQDRLFLLDGTRHEVIRLNSDLSFDRSFP